MNCPKCSYGFVNRGISCKSWMFLNEICLVRYMPQLFVVRFLNILFSDSHNPVLREARVKNHLLYWDIIEIDWDQEFIISTYLETYQSYIKIIIVILPRDKRVNKSLTDTFLKRVLTVCYQGIVHNVVVISTISGKTLLIWNNVNVNQENPQIIRNLL